MEMNRSPGTDSLAHQPPTPTAESALWQYRVPGADATHTDYFQQLQPVVEAELRRRYTRESLGQVGQRVYVQVQQYRLEAELISIKPWNAQRITTATRIEALYEEGTDQEQKIASFMAAVVDYPNVGYEAWFNSLVGIDEIKTDLLQKMSMFFQRQQLTQWSVQTYGRIIPACAALLNRYPFVILEGEVGAGKTALARSIGHPLATQLGRPVELLVVNTQVRGSGLVGEISRNLNLAFDEAERRCRQLGIPILLLIDEADALAQTRGHAQMHHEDQAGVNTLIQRIDLLRDPGKEVLVIFATNMNTVLDNAIQRRAAASYHFSRPGDGARRKLFQVFLDGCGLQAEHLDRLVQATCPRQLPGYGESLHPFTHSDIVQRLIPTAFERAYIQRASHPDLFDLLLAACHQVMPTPMAGVQETP